MYLLRILYKKDMALALFVSFDSSNNKAILRAQSNAVQSGENALVNRLDSTLVAVVWKAAPLALQYLSKTGFHDDNS